ncbi:PAS domain S-box protein [Desulfoscipio geothermicus]|uniref:PAS domain S-box-containing protein/diguanylate cyclase (GGDEF) domain-containing protein n=1 Tax=Desulfoscipio geothermicus DSM 3669 TaxID=1121426 RepID=A0A1I6DRN0_9FIRM|nr:PAS domain S-box protein [Desulfoscipio geothermicus]SFR08089.1 PAS domain S-box-containing protein/diguanylate cyclase (GGDEF) domain-containing protein [Desulfoscipio geothermicus DSM 3669]
MNQLRFTILDSIGEAVYVRDLRDNLLYANKAFIDFTGWSIEKLSGKKCYEIFDSTIDACVVNCPARKLNGAVHSCRVEKTIRIFGEEIRHVRVSASPLTENGQVTGSVIIMQDITRLREYENLYISTEQKLKEELSLRKILEKYLSQSEAIYRAMFEHTGTAMLVINEDRTIAMANRETERITGYTRDEIVGKRTWGEFVHPEDKERMLRYHTERRANGGKVPNQYEFRLIDSRGQIRHIFYTIAMIPGTKQSIGSMIDITERKQVELKLRESEEKYRLLLENIEDVFYEVDLRGNFTYVNDSAYRVFGYDKNELIGRNYRELVDQENARKAFAAYNKVFTSGIPERGFCWAITRPDGQKRDMEVSVSPIRDQRGNICGFRGTARDITERKQVEDRLRYLSLHDTLTGLYNRTYFEEEMRRLEKGRRFPVSLICGDLDGLKLINDTLGHKKGDQLLKAAARAIKEALRASDVVARMGGDEFVVVLPETDEAGAENTCRRIQESIDRHNRQNPELPLHISLGWSTAKTGSEMSNLFKRADNNMYREKVLTSNGSKSTIFRALMSALEDRDFIKQGHITRLQETVTGMGRALGLPNRELAELVLLAQFHDIGKVGLSDKVLFKSEPLTDSERVEIKSHCEIGYRIARAAPDLVHIADLILAHHEWWNGHGYPLGFSGKEIPVACRILAITDAYDAMTNDRPYRKALSREEAIAELQRCAGTQFDPKLVELFVKLQLEKRVGD